MLLKLLQAVFDAVPNEGAILLEWVVCFLDERIATDILEHLAEGRNNTPRQCRWTGRLLASNDS